MDSLAKLLVKKKNLKEYCFIRLEEDDFKRACDTIIELRELQIQITIVADLEQEKLDVKGPSFPPNVVKRDGYIPSKRKC